LRTKAKFGAALFWHSKDTPALAAVTAASAIVADAMIFMMLSPAINAPLTIE
jgi:hypothetical protein